MKFHIILTMKIGLMGHFLAAALPANVSSVTNVISDPMSRFSAPFNHTSDHQTFCEWGDANTQLGDTGKDYARRADCEGLANLARSRPGYWDISEWTAVAEEILENGTCHLRISRSDGGTGHLWIGNQDAGHFVGQATNLAHGGLMGVMGRITCSHPDGTDVEIILSVMK